MSRKTFDVDRFIDQLEMDEEIATYELTKPRKQKPYRDCPRCGASDWTQLKTDKRGKAIACSECVDVDNQ